MCLRVEIIYADLRALNVKNDKLKKNCNSDYKGLVSFPDIQGVPTNHKEKNQHHYKS